MKRRIYILMMLSMLLCGCTQNGGRIGPIFGSWHLEDMRCNGEAFPQPAGTDTYWSFQGNVARVLLVRTMYESEQYDATWQQTAGMLTLYFNHSCDGTDVGQGHYQAPQWMGFGNAEILDMDIERLTSADLWLRWTSDNGDVFMYKFKKTW